MPRTGLSAEELRERAITAALERIRLVGFDKVRLTDVAKSINVSHAALYAHFADKEALLDAVTERWLLKVEKAVGAVASSGGDPVDRIVEWFTTLYGMKRARALDDPEPSRAFDIATATGKPFVVAHLDNLIGQLSRLFSELGALYRGNPEQNAKLVYDATAAFHHPTIVAQTAKHDREPELRQIIGIMLRGLAAHP